MAQSSNLSLEEKHVVVQQWLSFVLTSDQTITDYPINAQAVDVLYSAALEAKQHEARSQLVAQGYRQKAEEYKTEASRLQALHKRLGITLSDLSTEARNALEDMVDLAISLDLKDCSFTSFLLAVSDHRRKQEQLKEKLKAKRKMERQFELSLNASTKANLYHQIVEKFQEEKYQQEEVREERLQYIQFLKQKSQQYQGQIITVQEELSRVGYQPSLGHSSLVRISQGIEELKQQLSPLKEQIASFQNLPPDMNLARIKLEEAKRELALLEDELTNKVDLTQAEK